MTYAPAFWMNETTGVLRPAVERYLAGEPLTVSEIASLRAYLRQWINCPTWAGPDIDWLRQSINGLTSRATIDAWLDRALESGIDPL